MPRYLDIDLTPEQYATPDLMSQAVARRLGLRSGDVAHIAVQHRSLDSRRGRLLYHTQVATYGVGEKYMTPDHDGHYQDCRHRPAVVIVGAGPAGLFAALKALQVGLRPVVIERGKSVEERKYDIARIAREQEVDANSNWCFGEGGAGTYSDGKLYTRSTKRGNVHEVLERFVEHGADPAILIDAHAHIGTDRLSGIIAAMRSTIEGYGGEYHFSSHVVDLLVKDDGASRRVYGVACADGTRYEGIAVVLATGHSARDIYRLFYDHGWMLQAKPFALGIRVEHPQPLIDEIQYHLHNPESRAQHRFLPPAAYSLTTQVEGHGVFSFCMCPGGVIVPAATAPGQQVVNGMSNSRRNSPFANSGIAVTVSLEDVPQYAAFGDLALLHFQQDVEEQLFHAMGDILASPLQRLTDFCESRTSSSNNKSNYMGTTVNAPVHELLPPFVVRGLQQGLRQFDQRMRGFYTSQASVLAVESRTSSPVRIPRGDDMQHPQLQGLYPCGEGAGYAGGIVSSALDGMNAMDNVYHNANIDKVLDI